MNREPRTGERESIAANPTAEIRDDTERLETPRSMPRRDISRRLFERLAREVHLICAGELDQRFAAKQDRFNRGLRERRRLTLPEFLETGEKPILRRRKRFSIRDRTLASGSKQFAESCEIHHSRSLDVFNSPARLEYSHAHNTAGGGHG